MKKGKAFEVAYGQVGDNKKEDFSGLENLLTKTLNRVIRISEDNPMSYACLDCQCMWLEDTFKDAIGLTAEKIQDYSDGYFCPQCGSENVSGKKS